MEALYINSPALMVFAEVLAGVVSWVGAGLLWYEYKRVSHKPVKLLAIGWACLGAGFLSWYVAQGAIIFDRYDAGIVVYQLAYVWINLGGAVITLSLASLLKKKWQQMTYCMLLLASFLAATPYILYNKPSLRYNVGMPLDVVLPYQYFIFYAPLLLSLLMLCWIGISSIYEEYVRKAGKNRALRYFGYTGVLGISAVILAPIGDAMQLPLLDVFIYWLMVPISYSLFLGTVSFVHPEPDFKKNPAHIFKRMLLFKVGAMNTVLAYAVSFVLIGVMVSYHVHVTHIARDASIKSALENVARTHSVIAQQLDSEVAFVANVISENAVQRNGGFNEAELHGYINAVKDNDWVAAVFLPDGSLASSTSGYSYEIQTSVHRDFIQQAESLDGIQSIRSMGSDFSSYLSGHPIMVGDDLVGVLVGIALPTYMLTDMLAEIPTGLVSSHGIVGQQGQSLVHVGAPLSDEVLLAIEGPEKVAGFVMTETHQGVVYTHAMRGASGEMSPPGVGEVHYYAFLDNTLRYGHALRMVYGGSYVVLLAVMLMTFVLFLSLVLITKPIRQLIEAISHISEGKHSAFVPISTQDEMGVLVGGFNDMNEIINDRSDSLQEVLRQQKDFLTGAAHDIKNPLNRMSWALELMEGGESGKLNAEQKDLVKNMRETSKHLYHLVQNIVDVGRLDENLITIDKECLDLSDVIDGVVAAMEPRANMKGLDLIWNREAGLVAVVYSDRSRVERVFFNIIGNAIKYTDEGSVEVQVHRVHSSGPSGKKGQYARFSVTDTGRGIPQDEIGEMFRKFYRASNVRSTGIEGTGLGLYITKQFIELHDGEMWVESTLGSGSVFYCTLPLATNECYSDSEA